MTNDLFDNIPEFFEGLQTALEGKPDETTIRVTKGGKLHFTKKLMFGKQEKTFNLTIPLNAIEEEEEELSGSLEEQIQRLFKEVKALKKENRELKAKLGCDYEMISPSFDINCYHACYFKVHGGKSVTRADSNHIQIYPINSAEKISRTKNTKFRVLIERYGMFVAFGVTIEKNLNNMHWFNEDESYAIVMPDEIRRNRISVKLATYSKLFVGSVVGILFVPSKNEIEFDVDGKHVYTVKIRPEHQMSDLYPIVGLQCAGDRVSFLETDE